MPTTSPHPILTKYYDSAADRQRFVTALFDDAARHYDRVCDAGSFGSVRLYRRMVLRRTGLAPGMTVLDLATGTGGLAAAAAEITGNAAHVVGLDASAGMLERASRAFAGGLVQGHAEILPFRDARFDLVTMAYAVRHVADLEVTFAECRRVLRPGGRLLLLEISRPESRVLRFILRLHLRHVVPWLLRPVTRGGVDVLLRYYWDTIADCVPAETILDVLRGTGFADARRTLRAGLLSEYVAVKPHDPSANREGERVDAAKAVPSHQPQQSPTVR